VLAGRSAQALRQLRDEIEKHGGRAVDVEADVGNEGDVERIATVADEEFGGIDTWINNAGVSIYGRLEETPIEDFRHLFETNFWGMAYGSLTAVRHMRGRGGAIINLGSVVSDTVIPLQGMYCATKHAVKAFTEALRMELDADGIPLSVTLVKPAAIDTPYPQHAKNYLEEEPALPPPLYAPDVVAKAILRCAEVPQAEVIVGGAGKLLSMSGRYTPRLRDKLFERTMFSSQYSGKPTNIMRHNALDEPSNELKERGDRSPMTLESSMYTQASLHPIVSGLMLLGGGVALASLVRGTVGGSSLPEQGVV
jgi:short-subunit dehydrogenase